MNNQQSEKQDEKVIHNRVNYSENQVCPCCGERSSEDGKELCKVCSEPYKEPKSNSDQNIISIIRTSYKKDKREVYEFLNIPHFGTPKGILDRQYAFYGRGYKTATQSAQAEIEELKKNLDDYNFTNMKQAREIEEFVIAGKIDSDLLVEQDSRIKELETEYRKIDNINTDLRIEVQKLKQQIGEMKCCHNCKTNDGQDCRCCTRNEDASKDILHDMWRDTP